MPRRTPSGLHVLREPEGKRKTTEHVLTLRNFRFKAHMLETGLQHTLCLQQRQEDKFTIFHNESREQNAGPSNSKVSESRLSANIVTEVRFDI